MYMSFFTWLRRWLGSIGTLFSIGSPGKRLSAEEKRKLSERRLSERYGMESPDFAFFKKQRKPRRSSTTVQHEKMVVGIVNFVFATLSFFAVVAKFVSTQGRRKKRNSGSEQKNTASFRHPNPRSKKSKAENSFVVKTTDKTRIQKKATSQDKVQNRKVYAQTAQKPPAYSLSEASEQNPHAAIALSEEKEAISLDTKEAPAERKEINSVTPKSAPQGKRDRFVKKRMTLAGSSYSDQKVLVRLAIGSRLNVVAEPDNAYDKNAIALFFEDVKVGYIPRKENLPFATCLKLGSKAYAIITAIDESIFPTRYEFEVWIEEE